MPHLDLIGGECMVLGMLGYPENPGFLRAEFQNYIFALIVNDNKSRSQQGLLKSKKKIGGIFFSV